MKCPAGPFLVLAIGSLGLSPVPLGAEPGGRGQPLELHRGGSDGLTAEEEQDAREIADRINEAVNIRREVTITLLNDTTLTVPATSRVTARRTWLIIASPDGSEIRFRAALIATVRIK